MFSTLGFNLTSELQLRLWDSRYLKDTVFESTIERNTPNIGVLLYDVSSKLICCSTRKSSCLKFFKLDCSQTKLIPYPEIELEGSDHLALAFRQPTMDHDLPDLFRIHSEAIENISVFWKKGFDSTFAHEENHALDGIRIFDELQNIRHGDLFRDQIEASDSNNTSDSLASKKKTLIKLIQEDKFSEDELSFMLDTRTSPMRQTLRSSVDLTFRKINELQSAIQKDLSQVKKIQSMRDDAFTILEEIRNQLGVVSLDDPQVIESHHEPKLKSGRLFKNYQANHQVASVMDPEPSSTPIEAFKSLPAQVRKLKQNSLKGNSSQDEIQQFRLSISASFEQNHIAVYLKSCWFDI